MESENRRPEDRRLGKFFLFCSPILLVLAILVSAIKPNPSSGTFSAWLNANNWSAVNQTIFSAPSEGSVNDSGLVLYMRFNNNSAIGESGNRTVDLSGLGNNGTCYGVAGQVCNWTTSGRFGSALQFDGVDHETSLQLCRFQAFEVCDFKMDKNSICKGGGAGNSGLGEGD